MLDAICSSDTLVYLARSRGAGDDDVPHMARHVASIQVLAVVDSDDQKKLPPPGFGSRMVILGTQLLLRKNS